MPKIKLDIGSTLLCPYLLGFALTNMQDDGHQQFELELLDINMSIFGQCWSVRNVGLALISS